MGWNCAQHHQPDRRGSPLLARKRPRMTGCFAWLILLGGGVFIMVSLLRWFEQTADAVDHGLWNKLALLIVFPFAAWFYPSRYAAGRPTAVAHHEPVRG